MAAVKSAVLELDHQQIQSLNPVIVVRLSPEGIAAFERYRASESQSAGFLLARNAVARKILEKELIDHGDLVDPPEPKKLRAGTFKRRIQDLERDVAALRSALQKNQTGVWFD